MITRNVRGHFKDIQEHDEVIINNWNNIVKKQDLIYICGDLVWNRDYEYLNKLNGQKIIIKGNHDCSKQLQKAKDKNIICNYYDIKGFMYKNDYVVLCHYALLSWDRRNYGAYMGFGHSHNSLDIVKGRSMDVGLDAQDYKPIHIDDFISKLKYRDNDYFYNTRTGEKIENGKI